MKIIKNIAAILLIIGGLWGDRIIDWANTPTKPDNEVLSVDKPDQITLSEVSEIDKIITETDDRVKMAIFNFQFATNVLDYNSTVQQANDVYALAGKIFFKEQMAGKYKGLGDAIIKLISSVTTNDDHRISEEERKAISKKFMGLTWVLLQ